MEHTRRSILLCLIVLTAAAAVYQSAINPDKFGFYHDDGIYLTTAKALATNNEYRILSLPGQPRETKYPILFPLALSALWRLYPDFPANIAPFAAFSALCMLAFLAISTAYFVKQNLVSKTGALLILVFAAFNWRTTVLATSILSEGLYAAISISALWLTESLDKKQTACRSFALGILLPLAVLTRVSGLALLTAIIFCAFYRKRFRRVWIPALLGISAAAGWFWWCSMHTTSLISPYEAYYTSYFRDWTTMLGAGASGFAQSWFGAFGLTVGKNVFGLLVNMPMLCLGVGTHWYSGLGNIELFFATILGLVVWILLIGGFFRTLPLANGYLHAYFLTYICLHIIWPYGLYDRFLIPLLPIILLFIIAQITHMWHMLKQEMHARIVFARPALFVFAFVALPSMALLAVYGSARGLYEQMITSKKQYALKARQDKELAGWIRLHSNKSDIIACYRDPIYYLYSDRRAIRLPAPLQTESFERTADQLFRFVDETKIKYLVQTSSDYELEANADQKRGLLEALLKFYPRWFIPVFSAQSGTGMIYEIQKSLR